MSNIRLMILIAFGLNPAEQFVRSPVTSLIGCFSCSSEYDERCKDPSMTMSFGVVYCSFGCEKRIEESILGIQVKRGCIEDIRRYHYDNCVDSDNGFYKRICHCEGNLCNGFIVNNLNFLTLICIMILFFN
ncbi:hypothetical protein ACOME3_005977 [Neoechinorhynchus agilis]